ncbi:MAG: thymidylate synthase [Cyanobacteria bacterium J06635_11]
MTQADENYEDIVMDITRNGFAHETRLGAAYVLPSLNVTLTDFPLLTTKKINWKNVVIELLWFLRCEKQTRFMLRHGVKIWEPWTDEYGVVECPYGWYWDDQVAEIVHELEVNPQSRRMVLTAWDPSSHSVYSRQLVPCHMSLTVNVIGGKLYGHLFQRSCDVGIGLPYNWASYWLLLELFGRASGYPVAQLTHSIANAHIYEPHVEPLLEQIERCSFEQPKLWLDEGAEKCLVDPGWSDDVSTEFLMSFFEIDYESHPHVPLEVLA